MLNAAFAKVSVVLCTFNGATFIEAQLRSILAQSHPLHEIVVVDDCSSDKTMEIVQTLAAQFSSIRLYQNSHNLGYNKNFEKALSLATGDVLAIADQDDVWHPQKIELMLQQWRGKTPLIYCNSALFSGTDPQAARPNPMMRRFEGSDPRKIAVYNTASGHAMVLKKELFQLALPFHPHVYYDWWLTVVAACNGGVAYCPEVLVYQRWHGGNATAKPGLSASELHRREKEMVLRNLEQFRKAPGISDDQLHFFETVFRLWQHARQGKNKMQLFFFLMRHRQLIYFSKVRKAAFLSHLKRSWRYAFH